MFGLFPGNYYFPAYCDPALLLLLFRDIIKL